MDCCDKKPFYRCPRFFRMGIAAAIFWTLALLSLSLSESIEYCPDCWQIKRRYSLNPLNRFRYGLTFYTSNEPPSFPLMRMHNWFVGHYETSGHVCAEFGPCLGQELWMGQWLPKGYYSTPRDVFWYLCRRNVGNSKCLDQMFKDDPELAFLMLKNMAAKYDYDQLDRLACEIYIREIVFADSRDEVIQKWKRKLTTNLINSGNPVPTVFPKAKAIVDKNESTD